MERTFFTVVVVASLGFGLVQLDVSIVNVALVTFATQFHASTSEVAWIVDAYAIAFASMLIASGALGDRIGSKRTFLGGLALFGVASLGCALAPNVPFLITMRVLQGVGAAALVPCSLALISHAAHDDATRRAHAIASWTAAGSISLALGPIAGGLLLATSGWRGIFLINLPICAVAIWVTARFVTETNPQTGRFDLFGQVLSIVTLVAATATIIEMGALGFEATIVRVALVVTVLCGAVFVAFERSTGDPMMPMHFFRDATFSAAVAIGLAINASLYGTLFALGFYLQRERGYSPLEVGCAFVPFAAILGCANIASGRIVAKHGPRIPLVAGLMVALGGFALLLVCNATTPYLALLPALLVIPAGIGTAVPAMTAALLGTVPRARSGVASGILNTVRQAAGALGVASCAAFVTRRGLVAGLHDVTLLWLLVVALAVGVAATRVAPTRSMAGSSRDRG